MFLGDEDRYEEDGSPDMLANINAGASEPGEVMKSVHPTVAQLVDQFTGTNLKVALLVPQREYRPNIQSNVTGAVFEPPIMFRGQNPHDLGINCRDAMNSRFTQLADCDDPMFQTEGRQISIHINVSSAVAFLRTILTLLHDSGPDTCRGVGQFLQETFAVTLLHGPNSQPRCLKLYSGFLT